MYNLTLLFSERGSPHIEKTILAYDHITRVFDTYVHKRPTLAPSLHNAVLRALHTLSSYYSRTDDAYIYSMAMRACFSPFI